MTAYLDRLEAGLFALVAAATPSLAADEILWAPSEYPRSSQGGAAVSLFRRGGGWAEGEQSTPGRGILLPTEATITVTGSPAAARACTIYATGARWRVSVPGGTSDPDFRDAIIAALSAAGHSLRATITDVDDDQVSLVGDFLGSLGTANPIEVRGDATASTVAEQLARVTYGTERSRVEVQTHSIERYPHGGAHDVSGQIRAALHAPHVMRLLDGYGLAIADVGPLVDLTSLSGPTWQSRAVFDVFTSQRADRADAVEAVAEVAAAVTDQTLTTQIEVNP